MTKNKKAKEHEGDKPRVEEVEEDEDKKNTVVIAARNAIAL
jgi:hypothetical protein